NRVGGSWSVRGERRYRRKSAANSITVEASKHSVVFHPASGDRASSGDKGEDGFRLDLRDGDVSHSAVKRSEYGSWGSKAHPQGMLIIDIGFDDIEKFHDTSPK